MALATQNTCLTTMIENAELLITRATTLGEPETISKAYLAFFKAHTMVPSICVSFVQNLSKEGSAVKSSMYKAVTSKVADKVEMHNLPSANSDQLAGFTEACVKKDVEKMKKYTSDFASDLAITKANVVDLFTYVQAIMDRPTARLTHAEGQALTVKYKPKCRFCKSGRCDPTRLNDNFIHTADGSRNFVFAIAPPVVSNLNAGAAPFVVSTTQ